MGVNNLTENLSEKILERLAQREKVVLNIKELETEKRLLDKEIKQFNESYTMLTGESFLKVSDNRSTADIIEEILRKHGDLHVDKILELAQKEINAAGGDNERTLEKQSLVATLVRYVQQNRRFRRIEGRANTFGLVKE